MYNILLVVHVILTLALIVVILVQRSSTDGFGMGSGSGGGLMTGRASANLLTRITAITATLFIINSLALGILTKGERRSITDDVMQIEQQVNRSAAVSDNDNKTVEGENAVPSGAAVTPKTESTDNTDSSVTNESDTKPAAEEEQSAEEEESPEPDISVPKPGMKK